MNSASTQGMKVGELIDILRIKCIESDVSPSDFSLLTGALSKSFFYSALGESKITVIREINRSIKNFHSTTKSTSFVDGIAGFGWGINFLVRKNNITVDINKFLEDVDNLLIDELKKCLRNGKFEFFYGVAGYLLYFIERAVSNVEMKFVLEDVIKEVNASIRDNNSIENRDFSISHGTAGLICVLVSAYELKLNINPQILESITILTEEIRLSSFSKDDYVLLPDMTIEAEKKVSPLRWCHGQLGITYALSKAYKLLKDEKILDLIVKSGKWIISRTDTENEELNSSIFCHGSIGVAHTLRGIAENTGLKNFEIASKFWYRIGYNQICEQIDKRHLTFGGETASGLLTGLEGVGLMILDNEKRSNLPEWDKCLLF